MPTDENSRPLRVLLVEDDEDDYLLCRDLLAEGAAGFELTWVRQYEAAREALEQGRFDICLLDYRFGAQTGLELLRDAVGRGCRTPMILLTGRGDHHVDVEAMQAGAADYLVKGHIDGALLERAIRHAIGRRHAEEALRESEQLYSATFDEAAVGIVHTSPDGCFLRVNHRFCEVTGYAGAELLGRRWEEITYPEDLPAAATAFRRLLAGEIQHFSSEMRYLRKDGALVWAKVFVSPHRNAAGALKHFITVVDDITERRRLEEELRQSQKMEAIGRLAGGIAHDFNNMLGAITGYADLLLHRVGPDPTLQSFLQEIMKASERAANLTRQLLAFSRKSVVAPRVLDLNEVIAGMHPMVRRLIGEDIEMVTLPAPSAALVKADPGQIEQVIMNLAVNARDAMPQGGKLTIQVSQGSGVRGEGSGASQGLGDRGQGSVTMRAPLSALTPDPSPLTPLVLLTVSDTGCGMDATTQARIFEPFFTTKEPDKGTGLGLATVYAIVQQSGGLIEVESQPGAGATFRVYLQSSEEPVRADRGASAPGAEATADPAAGSKTILLVEDEPVVRKLVHEVLDMNGYTVLEAIQGDDALRLCEEHGGRIDLLLTDVMMPGMSGRELAQRVAVLQPEARVLFMSGYTDDAVLRHGVLDAGIAFIQKPFKPAALAQKVREVLASH